MAITRMVDMEFDDEDSLDAAQPIPMPDRPRYPYGLRICLTDKELDKLPIPTDDMPQIGDLIDLRAMARVTSVSCDESEDGPARCRIELQITHLAVENEETQGPGDDAPKRPARGVLYDRSRDRV